MTEFTNEELIHAIQTAVNEAPDFDPRTFTTKEYAEITGLSNDMALKQLKKIAAEVGIIVPEGHVRRLSFWGHETKVRGWRYTGSSFVFDKRGDA